MHLPDAGNVKQSPVLFQLKRHITKIKIHTALPTRPHTMIITLKDTQAPGTNSTLQRVKNVNAQPILTNRI